MILILNLIIFVFFIMNNSFYSLIYLYNINTCYLNIRYIYIYIRSLRKNYHAQCKSWLLPHNYFAIQYNGTWICCAYKMDMSSELYPRGKEVCEIIGTYCFYTNRRKNQEMNEVWICIEPSIFTLSSSFKQWQINGFEGFS